MSLTLSFNEQARSEIQEAAHYYGLESPNLRVAFLDAISSLPFRFSQFFLSLVDSVVYGKRPR